MHNDHSTDGRGAGLSQIQKTDAIGQLTSGIAHDFNDILATIVNNLDLLKRNISGARDLAMIEAAQAAATKGGVLIGQLLTFARQQELKPLREDLNSLIKAIEPVLRHNAGDRVDVTIRTPDAPAFAEIDALHFETALLNLVINARDAMPQGGRLDIGAAIDDIRDGGADVTPGRYVRLAVSDTGTGMSEDVRRRAFEPFFTTKDIGKGSGLGLSQVYGFAIQSGGTITIESRMGSGTTVAILLPLHDGAEPGLSENPAAEAAPRQASIVLVVEDDPGLLMVAVELFRDLGFEVVTAADSNAALDVLKGDKPIRLLFTDIVMPRGMNGVELAREAKALSPETRILLASGYPRGALKARGLTEDMSFIGKPYRWDDLAAQMRAMGLMD